MYVSAHRVAVKHQVRGGVVRVGRGVDTLSVEPLVTLEKGLARLGAEVFFGFRHAQVQTAWKTRDTLIVQTYVRVNGLGGAETCMNVVIRVSNLK